jgi:hypothetical protein
MRLQVFGLRRLLKGRPRGGAGPLLEKKRGYGRTVAGYSGLGTALVSSLESHCRLRHLPTLARIVAEAS